MYKDLFEELVSAQEEKIYQCAKSIIPNITKDDLLQPNDYRQLELNPYFRYEEGVLEGLRTAQMALIALLSDPPKEF